MADPTGGKQRSRVQLVEVLIGAVCAGGPRLQRARADFERLDPRAGLGRLVMQAVDPELLAAVVGPRLVSVWVDPLREQYARFRREHPADWVDVEKVWREQRPRWRRALDSAGSTSGSGAAGSALLSRGYPERDPHSVRAAPSRGGSGSSPRAGVEPSRRQPARAHRPVPAGVGVADDSEVEPVVTAPDPVLSGAVALEAADVVARDARRGKRVSSVPGATARPSAGSAPRPGVNGVPVVAPPVSRGAAPATDDQGVVLSGKAGALVERLLQAMANSRARVDSVRRVWIDAEGLSGGWDLWAVDAAVIDAVRRVVRTIER